MIQNVWRIAGYVLGRSNEVIEFIDYSTSLTAWGSFNEGITAAAITSLAAVWLQNSNIRWYYQPTAADIREEIYMDVPSYWTQGGTIGTNVDGLVQPA